MSETDDAVKAMGTLQKTIDKSLATVDVEGARALLLVVRAEMVAQHRTLVRHEEHKGTPKEDSIGYFKDLTIFQGHVKMAENLVTIIEKG